MKNLIYILTLLFALPLTSLAQNDTVVVYNNYKYKIGFKFSSDKSGDLSLSPNTYQVFSVGIQLIKKIKKSHFSLLSGLYYYNRAFEINYYNKYAYIYHTMNLPLGIRYENKIFYLSGEVYANYSLNKRISEDRIFNTGFILAIGIEKNISKQLNLFFEAHDMSNLTSTQINERSEGLTYLVNYGFSLGLNYKILKH